MKVARTDTTTQKSMSCRDCIWKFQCSHTYRCSNYSPMSEEGDNEYINEIVESERDDFREAWFEYVGFSDEDFMF